MEHTRDVYIRWNEHHDRKLDARCRKCYIWDLCLCLSSCKAVDIKTQTLRTTFLRNNKHSFVYKIFVFIYLCKQYTNLCYFILWYIYIIFLYNQVPSYLELSRAPNLMRLYCKNSGGGRNNQWDASKRERHRPPASADTVPLFLQRMPGLSGVRARFSIVVTDDAQPQLHSSPVYMSMEMCLDAKYITVYRRMRRVGFLSRNRTPFASSSLTLPGLTPPLRNLIIGTCGCTTCKKMRVNRITSCA